jgi:septation ring formation regulator EzrA
MVSYVLFEEARDEVLKTQEVYDEASKPFFEAEHKYREAKNAYDNIYENPAWYNVLFIPAMKEELMMRQKKYGDTMALFMKAQEAFNKALKNYDYLAEKGFEDNAYEIGAF